MRCGRSARSDLLINAGFFVFRQEIFDYIEPGEELVLEPFARLIAEQQAHRLPVRPLLVHGHVQGAAAAHRPLQLGRAPWEVWKSAEGKTAANNGAAPRFEAQDATAWERTAAKSVAGIRP